jgi:hypothetical protein
VEPRGLSSRLTMVLYPLTRRSPDHALGRLWHMPGGYFLGRTSQNSVKAKCNFREIVKVEVRRISLLRTPVNKGYTNGRGC